MSAITQQLSKLGITLSTPSAPAAAYVMAVTSGDQVYLSGHIAKQDGKPWVGISCGNAHNLAGFALKEIGKELSKRSAKAKGTE